MTKFNLKKENRLRRIRKFRAKNKELNATRLCVHRTSAHIYAQITSGCGAETLASVSSLSAKIKNGGNIEAAKKVGELIAKAAKKAKIEKVSFDRSGFKYHGRVKALAEAARSNGLIF